MSVAIRYAHLGCVTEAIECAIRCLLIASRSRVRHVAPESWWADALAFDLAAVPGGAAPVAKWCQFASLNYTIFLSRKIFLSAFWPNASVQ
jgi:hypothetical protein